MRRYQVAVITYIDPDFPECGNVHFAAQHHDLIVLSRLLQDYLVPGAKVVWWRWKS